MSSGFAVVGAGLVGRLLALNLARQGHKVRLYERGGADGSDSAAYVAAAMLAPLAESVVSEPIITRLGLASLDLWPKIIESLPEAVFFQREGTLVVWHAEDSAQASIFETRLRHKLAELLPFDLEGVKHSVSLRREQIAELEPCLSNRFQRGIYLPGEGQLDNRAMLRALGLALEDSGVELFWHTEIVPDEIKADLVIDCRGFGARPDVADLRGIRGEVVRVHSSDVKLERPIRLLHPRYPLYIAPKPDGQFVIGATEIETEDFSPASVRSALELLSALYSVHPAFGEARILEIKVQLRPTLKDNLPAIFWNGGNMIRVNGLYRHGFLAAPAVTDAAMSLIGWLENKGSSDWDLWRSEAPWGSIYHMI